MTDQPTQLNGKPEFKPEPNYITYSIHTQVNGTWRHEGFINEGGDVEAKIAEARELCIKENGPDTFRSFAFLNEPHKASQSEPMTDPAQVRLTDALLEERMG